MPPSAYRTVTEPGRAAFRVSGSRFVGHVAAATTEREADAVVTALETVYDDATHVVPAYRVRSDPFREYASDAGEPAGSAGDPMLGVLAGEDLENVVAVVVRYYGGTNLGVGGLVSAYGRAVSGALEAATVGERRPTERHRITVDYDDSGTVRSVLESEGVAFDATYDEQVGFDVRVPRADAEALVDRIASATSGRADVAGDSEDDATNADATGDDATGVKDGSPARAGTEADPASVLPDAWLESPI